MKTKFSIRSFIITPALMLGTSLAFFSVSLAQAADQSTTQKEPVKPKLAEKTSVANDIGIEEITVYGRHNQLITESGTATKSNMSLIKTPAAVVVVDAALLREQSSETLQNSIKNISGLTQDGNNYGVGDNLAIRGLGVNYTYDGIYAGGDLDNSYNPTRSTTNISSIEVLKGPATGLYGMGAAGGIINLIEKKPQDQERYQLRTSIGQWNAYSAMFDATAALTDRTAYRVVVNHESSDGYRGVGSERSEVYASLRYDVSDTNQLIFSAAYLDDAVQVDSVGHPVRIVDQALIGINDGAISAADFANGDLTSGGLQLSDAQRQQLADSLAGYDRSRPFDIGDTSLVSPLSTPNEGQEARFKVRQDINFANDWSLTHQLQYRTYESDYVRQTSAFNYNYFDRNGVINLGPRAPLVIDDVLYPFAARRQEYRNITADETAVQYFTDLSKAWSSDSIKGEHLISANYESRDINFQQFSIWDADDSRSEPVPYILDIRDPNWGTGSFDDLNPALRSRYEKSVTSFGISAQEVLYLSDALTARVGAAYSKVKQTYQNQTTDATPEFDADDSGFTYNVGLSYLFNDQVSAFVNASKGRTAYSILGSLNGESDRPDSESESFDIGIRFKTLKDNLLASLVFFDTARTNLRYSNPLYEDDPSDQAFNIDVSEFFFDEKNQTQGIEFDLNMVLNDQWSMNWNATFQDPATVPGSNASNLDEVQTKGIAETSSSLWATYSSDFALLPNPLSFSLGINYEGERSISSSSFGIDEAFIDSYTVVDAAVAYSSENWDVQLNLGNLGDETYYSKAMFLGGLPGEERNARLTFSYSF